MIIKDTRVLRSYKIQGHELQLFKELERDEYEEEHVWTEMVDTGETEEYETGEFETVETGNMIEVETGEVDEDGNPITELVPETVQVPVMGTRPVYEEVEHRETVTIIRSYTYKFLTLPWRDEFEGTYVEDPGSENPEEPPLYIDYVEENFDILWEEAEAAEAFREQVKEYNDFVDYIDAEIDSTNKYDLDAYRRLVESNGDNIAEMDMYRDDILDIRQQLKDMNPENPPAAAKFSAGRASSRAISKPEKPVWADKY